MIHFGVFLTNEKMFLELTDPDPDLSVPGPGSSFSDPWQLYYQTRSKFSQALHVDGVT